MATTANPILELFLSRKQIQQRIAEMGAQISRDFAGQTIVLVGVLKGAAIFLADLARSIQVDCTFDFVAVSSYEAGPSSSGTVRLLKDLDLTIENRNVILVEDILDTGVTLRYLQTLLLNKKPARLMIAALLDKPSRRREAIEADYAGFSIPNRFVAGIWHGFGRNVPKFAGHLPFAGGYK